MGRHDRSILIYKLFIYKAAFQSRIGNISECRTQYIERPMMLRCAPKMSIFFSFEEYKYLICVSCEFKIFQISKKILSVFNQRLLFESDKDCVEATKHLFYHNKRHLEYRNLFCANKSSTPGVNREPGGLRNNLNIHVGEDVVLSDRCHCRCVSPPASTASYTPLVTFETFARRRRPRAIAAKPVEQ